MISLLKINRNLALEVGVIKVKAEKVFSRKQSTRTKITIMKRELDSNHIINIDKIMTLILLLLLEERVGVIPVIIREVLREVEQRKNGVVNLAKNLL
jgi:hypothetical protein